MGKCKDSSKFKKMFIAIASLSPNHKYRFHLWHNTIILTALAQSAYTSLCERGQHALEFIVCDWCLITVLQAEKKHKSFQELDRFMHYYTRFKNHEHSYQVNKPGFVFQWCPFCIVCKQSRMWPVGTCHLVATCHICILSNVVYCSMMKVWYFCILCIYNITEVCHSCLCSFRLLHSLAFTSLLAQAVLSKHFT